MTQIMNYDKSLALRRRRNDWNFLFPVTTMLNHLERMFDERNTFNPFESEKFNFFCVTILK